MKLHVIENDTFNHYRENEMKIQEAIKLLENNNYKVTKL